MSEDAKAVKQLAALNEKLSTQIAEKNEELKQVKVDLAEFIRVDGILAKTSHQTNANNRMLAGSLEFKDAEISRLIKEKEDLLARLGDTDARIHEIRAAASKRHREDQAWAAGIVKVALHYQEKAHESRLGAVYKTQWDLRDELSKVKGLHAHMVKAYDIEKAKREHAEKELARLHHLIDRQISPQAPEQLAEPVAQWQYVFKREVPPNESSR